MSEILFYPKEYYASGVLDDTKEIVRYIADKLDTEPETVNGNLRVSVRSSKIALVSLYVKDGVKTIDITVDDRTINVSTSKVDVIIHASPVLETVYHTSEYTYISAVLTGSVIVEVEEDGEKVRISLYGL